MSGDTIERMNYFQFQQVGAEDFRLEQEYHRDARARHDLGPHSWGIVQGCEIVESQREGDADFVDIKVMPGMAVDGFGRRIMLLEPVAVPPELFTVFNSERLLELWLHYEEFSHRDADDARTTICIGDSAYSRVVESYRFVIGTLTELSDDVIVGGDVAKPALPDGSADGGAPILPLDKTVAAQEFPAELAEAFWPIRLGSVRWDGTVRKFRPVLDPADLTTERRYAGFIGASLLAEGNKLRVAPRIPDPAGADAQDFASIEGRLRVDGRVVARKDVFLHGGMLSFQSVGGSDETVPLTLRRIPDASGSGADLRVQIGEDPSSPVARMTVGTGLDPFDSDPAAVVVSVRADNRVDIPNGRLRFTGAARQAIDLGVPDDTAESPCAIGWQGSNHYSRTGNSFYWYRNGLHDPTSGNPGTGGTVLMRLTGAGSLAFGEDFRQVLNFTMSGQSYGIGAQDETLYFRTGSNFAWYRGGGHDDGALSNGGGATAMELDNSSRLTVNGGVRSRGRIEIHGERLAFLDTGGNTNTDPLEIYRHQAASDANHLRVRIGDNSSGDDRFSVGTDNGGFTERFWADNRGDGFFGRNLDVVGVMRSRGQDVLIDVIAGEFPLNRQGAGAGTHNLELISNRIANIGSAQLMVGLADIRNVSTAVGARWRVHYVPGTHTVVGGNRVTFPVQWTIEDIDGHLLAYSYVAVLTP